LEGTLMLMVQGNLRSTYWSYTCQWSSVSIDRRSDYRKIETVRKSLIQDFSINKPKIAVLGLNPHCGDGGVIGKEDDGY
jgi:4-hydroxythreonine-4-phosphate dehydrogenase